MANLSLKYTFAALLLLQGVALAEESAPEISAPDELLDGERPRNTFVWVDPIKDLAPDAVASDHISKILFVNRCVGGCSITPGTNDSRNNTSSIPSSPGVVSEFSGGDAIWNEAMDCIREVYAPYDVQVVDVDPGNEVFHHEAILAGLPGDVGLSNSIGGIAPSSCSPLNNVISFSFANAGFHANDPIRMCATVAQESAHAFGLPNHVFNCLDPMTYLEGCGKKLFRNQGYPCGEFSIAPCNCSGATQNSHVELLNVFGPGTTEIAGPEVSIVEPAADATVLENFTIFWSATDARLIRKNEVWVNGTKVMEVPGNEYDNQTPGYQTPQMPNMPDGYLDIEIHSFNDLNVETVEKVTVLKGQPCANKDSCDEFQTCEEGRCRYGAAVQELGESCNVTQECAEGICSQVTGEKACSVSCNPNVTGGCVDGFECLGDVDGQFVCATAADTGGCCSVAGTKRDPLPWLGASFFMLGLMFLRRKKK